ncbi:MAG TPA: methyltransferase domain-containing protein [Thermoanaerobaculia bacterium]|jgi:SAM-dependent methyltransferase|nr:methyltransferase domain-containing protein [Thermoanaerobaculia bacterium]
MATSTTEEYRARVAAESRKWGEHLKVEAAGDWHAWIDHPLVNAHYRQLALVEGQPWEKWVATTLGHPAERSLDLGCGSGSRSLAVHQAGGSRFVEGMDVSEDRIAEGERIRESLGIPGKLRVDDINTTTLPRQHYELIFSAHSFHHFLELEHVMEQVHEALTPDGLFILEEFVGPTQFQWTDYQIEITRALLSGLPQDLRMLRWGALKHLEGRPTVAEVVAASPFESIRSAEIVPLFHKYFDIVTIRNLGGTIQHLLYNGIAHNFKPDRADVAGYVEAIYRVEDAMIDGGMLPSDFMLLVGRRRR